MISLAKTDITKGLAVMGVLDKSIGIVDLSTKVRLIFQDDTFITLNWYKDLNNKNKSGVPQLFMGLATDKYSLLLLKTKAIGKVEITGNGINASTFITDISAIDFLLDVECLESYL